MMSQVSNYNELDGPISPDADVELCCWISALSGLFLPVAEDGRDMGQLVLHSLTVKLTPSQGSIAAIMEKC